MTVGDIKGLIEGGYDKIEYGCENIGDADGTAWASYCYGDRLVIDDAYYYWLRGATPPDVRYRLAAGADHGDQVSDPSDICYKRALDIGCRGIVILVDGYEYGADIFSGSERIRRANLIWHGANRKTIQAEYGPDIVGIANSWRLINKIDNDRIDLHRVQFDQLVSKTVISG